MDVASRASRASYRPKVQRVKSAELKPKQEFQLKVKHFLPPNSYAPELYLLEVENRDDENETTGSTRPTTRSPQFTERVTDKPVASSHQPVASKYDPRSATYTNQTNDSGIAGLTPEEYRENYDDAERRKNEYNESRQKELENRLNGDRMNGDLDDSDRQRRLREDQEREEWERKNRDEDERRRREEEDRRRREEEERQREEDERRRREEEREKMAREKLSGSDERQLQGRMRKDLNRFPSPPPMNVASTDQDLDSGSQNLTKEQKQAEKKRLLQELEAAREARRAVERQREELVKKAKLMQNKTQNRRNHARDLWKKRYFEEKKRTPPLEEQCNKLRHELDVIHRKLMNALEGSSKDKNTRMENLKPSKQNNYKIQATRLTHEIDDLRRRLENAKMKLTAEMKLRNQAETELRALRAELTQKKIHLTLSRNQQMAMTPGGDSRYYRTPALSNKA
ncbi:Hypothetical predicted protein [Mytilus galloprovincialis]|uniref:Spermatogenesis-associated protein 1 C-terminal domain-containing protein n=1 Tax=Mytilus galloprovincialis TaxID=29158 RepID=A0A8B6E7U3_MYTGA|nr:Hypothetical predicted protein [Mytilus galloprovincialis]